MTCWPGFLLRDCRWLFLGPSMFSMSLWSRHCCEETWRVFVWIARSATITSCRGLRISSRALLWILPCAPEESSSTPLSIFPYLCSNRTTINNLIRPRGGQGIEAWTLRTSAAGVRSILGVIFNASAWCCCWRGRKYSRSCRTE